MTRLEKANRSDNDGKRLDAADGIRREAESLASMLFSGDASVED